ncbi:DUF4121 family protein [Lysinibacillus sp. UGB7]|uniref:DUF4121 family protein n=1 Tax=Lysinibacillus sp. UGB7 TaxID=3411039 RepID=UPI003B76E6BA
MNTINALKIFNESYDDQYGINEIDLEIIHEIIPIIENTRDNSKPQVGDIVQFTNRSGEYHAYAHIESVTNDSVYICEKPYVPFVEAVQNGEKIKTSTSGGAWFYIPQEIRFVGMAKKAFKAWGHNGPCANGAIQFDAEVSVWEYTIGEHKYTTKTHDKFVVYNSEDDKDTEYNYLVSKGPHRHTAFKTKEEYERWLKTFNGIETAGYDSRNTIVWTYKQKYTSIPLEDYLSLENSVIDSELWNGKHYECKRVVESLTITTYMPYMNERIEVEKN